jgi:hypothetical protein
MRVQLLGAHGFALARIADDDVAEARLEILEVLGKTEDRHDFGGHRNVEAGFARVAVGDAAERAHDFAQRPVVHVHHAAPHHAA